jgi:hypothetical protein
MGSFGFGAGYFALYALAGAGPTLVIGEPEACIVVPFDDRTISIAHDTTILVRFDDRNILTPESERCE